MQNRKNWAALTVSLMIAPALLLGACGDTKKETKTENSDTEIAFPSTYVPLDSQPTLITNAHILDGIGGEYENGSVLIIDGKIAGVGNDISSDADGLVTIDANGAWVTPGVIDTHSHLGVYASPGVRAHSDGNEATSPNTAELSSEHGVWPQDPGFAEAMAGGVTTLHILPGSANLFGGRGTTLRNIPSRTVQGMKMPDAPATLKMACGENPKRVYGQKGGPASRMGNFAHYRKHWIKAQGYKKKLEDGELKPGDRNLQLETMAGVLNGEILVQMHCYRADEMAQVLDMSKEFGYKVSSFHHSVEAYKIGDLLKESGTCAAMWADWWGFKMEAYDGIQENIPFVHAQGACALIHSDSGYGVQRLNQEIAKAYGHGKRAGIDISKAKAWKWIAINAATAIGIEEQTGSLENGKRADVVIWSGDPFSTYTKADKVFLDGALMYDRLGGLKPISDFRLGQLGAGE